MKVVVGHFALPTGAGGTQAVDLSATFSGSEPLRAVRFAAGKNTANGAIDPGGAIGQFSVGFATNDGGSIQQGYIAMGDVDAAANADLSFGSGTGAALKGFTNGSASIDYEMDVTTFTDTGFTVTSTDPPPTGIIVCYIAFGGSDVSAARVFAFDTATGATQDVTINTGFGQPSFLMFATAMKATGDAAGSGGIGLGFAQSDTSRRFLGYSSKDAAATMNTGQWHGNRALVVINPATPAVDGEADLSSTASWPTDGFQLTWTDQVSLTHEVIGLALQGTFTANISSGASTTLGAPQTQTLTGSGETPRGLLMMGWPFNSTAEGAIRTTDGNLSAINLGSSDLTNHRTNGFTQDDAATTSVFSTYLHTSRVYEVRTLGASAALQAYTDSASANGTDVDIDWPDTDSGTSRSYSYVIFADASASLTAVGESLAMPWDIIAAVGESLQMPWDAKAVVGESLAARWDAKQLIAESLAVKWDAMQAAGESLAVKWDAKATIGESLATKWDIIAAIGESLQMPWDLSGPVGESLAIRWDADATQRIGRTTEWRTHIRPQRPVV